MANNKIGIGLVAILAGLFLAVGGKVLEYKILDYCPSLPQAQAHLHEESEKTCIGWYDASFLISLSGIAIAMGGILHKAFPYRRSSYYEQENTQN